MSRAQERVYTFHVDSREELDDLRDLWAESVVDWDTGAQTLRVKSDPLAMDQFLLFYDLYRYLEPHPAVVSDEVAPQLSAFG